MRNITSTCKNARFEWHANGDEIIDGLNTFAARLESLKYHNHGLELVDMNGLASALKSCSNLRKLELGGCTAEIQVFLTNLMPNLEDITIDDSYGDPDLILSWVGLDRCINLQKLDLTGVTIEQVEDFMTTPKPKLEEVCLRLRMNEGVYGPPDRKKLHELIKNSCENVQGIFSQ